MDQLLIDAEKFSSEISDSSQEYQSYFMMTERKFQKLFNSKYDENSAKNLARDFGIVEDDIEVSFAPWLTMIYSVVYDSISKFIHEAHQHGFIVHFERKYATLEAKWEDETKVLNMFMLSAGFYVWLASVAIAITVFICEHIYYHLKIKETKIGKIIMVKSVKK